jgi:hypothetical protein
MNQFSAAIQVGQNVQKQHLRDQGIAQGKAFISQYLMDFISETRAFRKFKISFSMAACLFLCRQRTFHSKARVLDYPN